MKAVGYIRVSDRREQSRGLGEESQRRAIVEYCNFKGIQVQFAEADIGVSGGRPIDKRKGGAELLALLDSGFTAVVVFKLDRLGRSVSDISRRIEEFRTRGIAVISVSENFDIESLTGWFMSQFLMLFAEFERRTGSERMKALHAALRDMGRARSHYAPYGWDKGPANMLVANEAEQKWRRWMKSQRTRGWTDAEIAAELRAKGVPSKGGGRWRGQSVRHILERIDAKPMSQDPNIWGESEPDAVGPDVKREYGNDDVTWSEHGDAQP